MPTAAAHCYAGEPQPYVQTPASPDALLAQLRQLAASDATLLALPHARQRSYLCIAPELSASALGQETLFHKPNMRGWRATAPALTSDGASLLGLASTGLDSARMAACHAVLAAEFDLTVERRLDVLTRHPMYEMQHLLCRLLPRLLFGAPLDYDLDAVLHATDTLECAHGGEQLQNFFGLSPTPAPDEDALLDARLVLHQALVRSYPAARALQVTDGLLALLRAAIASPAATCAWLCTTLARHPAQQTALRQVLAQGQHPSASRRALRAFLFETVRLYPPAWLLVRQALDDTTLGGQTICAGDQILVSPYVQHRLARSWESAEQFAPRRWLTGQPGPQSLLTFGQGARKCPAMQFSLQLLMLMAEQLLRRFKIELDSPEPAESVLWVNYRPAPPARLRFTPL